MVYTGEVGGAEDGWGLVFLGDSNKKHLWMWGFLHKGIRIPPKKTTTVAGFNVK